MMTNQKPSWISQDQGWTTKDLEGTNLTKRRLYHLKRSPEITSTMSYLNREGKILTEYRIFNKLSELGYDLVPERDNKSAYKPGDLVSQLARYGSKPKLSHDEKVLRQAMDITLRAFGGSHKLKVSPLSEDLRFFAKQEKSSGLPELTKKGKAFERDLWRASKIASGDRAPDPCVAYHRVQHGVKGPKTRLVWGYPQSVFLLEARFAPQLIDSYLNRRTPMAFGLLKSQVSARMQQIRNSGLRYSLDFSGFDSSISARWIDFAFSVLATHFHFTCEEEESVWMKIINYFIHTPIMLPNQEVWQKHHGVPSGSYFTQMVDSIVNFMAVTYAWLKATGRAVPEGRVLVLGDDSLVGQSKFVDLSELAHSMSELGLKLNVDKTEISRYGDGDPHFLGHFWGGGFAYRPLQELAVRLAFPEKPSGIKDSRERHAIRSLSYVSDSLNSQKLIQALAPCRTPWVEQTFVSFLTDVDLDREVESSMRPGMSSHLEDAGIIESLTSYSLAQRQPMIGPWM